MTVKLACLMIIMTLADHKCVYIHYHYITRLFFFISSRWDGMQFSEGNVAAPQRSLIFRFWKVRLSLCPAFMSSPHSQWASHVLKGSPHWGEAQVDKVCERLFYTSWLWNVFQSWTTSSWNDRAAGSVSISGRPFSLKAPMRKSLLSHMRISFVHVCAFTWVLFMCA